MYNCVNRMNHFYFLYYYYYHYHYSIWFWILPKRIAHYDSH